MMPVRVTARGLIAFLLKWFKTRRWMKILHEPVETGSKNGNRKELSLPGMISPDELLPDSLLDDFPYRG